MLLQRSEGLGKLDKRCTIAKSTGLALDDREIVPPIVNRLPRPFMRPADDATVLAYDQTLLCNNDTVWIYPNANGSVGIYLDDHDLRRTEYRVRGICYRMH